MEAAAPLHLGEVHTGLLQNSTEFTQSATKALLTLIQQEPVRTWERPVRHAASPTLLTGIDGDLPSAAGARVRAVGTVISEARVTAGRLLQSCARTVVVDATVRRRLPWTHYLTRPGILEAQRAFRGDDLRAGFLAVEVPHGTLDLGGICAHVTGVVQSSDLLDHAPPFSARRTSLRWTAAATEGSTGAAILLNLETPSFRSVQVRAPDQLIARLPELIRDIALHDWLLSAVVEILDLAQIGRRSRADVVLKLRPAVDHLLHVWMPAARIDRELAPYWAEIELRSGLSRQWDTAVRRIRDQLSLAGLEPIIVDLAGGRSSPRPT